MIHHKNPTWWLSVNNIAWFKLVLIMHQIKSPKFSVILENKIAYVENCSYNCCCLLFRFLSSKASSRSLTHGCFTARSLQLTLQHKLQWTPYPWSVFWLTDSWSASAFSTICHSGVQLSSTEKIFSFQMPVHSLPQSNASFMHLHFYFIYFGLRNLLMLSWPFPYFVPLTLEDQSFCHI